MDVITIAGYLSMAVSGAIGAIGMWKHKTMQSLRNTNDILKAENESLKSLLEVKEETIKQFARDLESVKNQIKIDRKVYDAKLEEIKKELDALKHENQLLHNQRLMNGETFRAYRQILVEIRQGCKDAECEQCKRITRALEANII